MTTYHITYHEVNPRIYIDAVIEFPVRPMDGDLIQIPGKYITQLCKEFVEYKKVKEFGILFKVQSLYFYPASMYPVRINGYPLSTEWNILRNKYKERVNKTN